MLSFRSKLGAWVSTVRGKEGPALVLPAMSWLWTTTPKLPCPRVLVIWLPSKSSVQVVPLRAAVNSWTALPLVKMSLTKDTPASALPVKRTPCSDSSRLMVLSAATGLASVGTLGATVS